MAELECPKCGLFSPDSAIRCDCGYDFVSRKARSAHGDVESEPIATYSQKRTKINRILTGLALVLGIFCFVLVGLAVLGEEGTRPLVLMTLSGALVCGVLALLSYDWKMDEIVRGYREKATTDLERSGYEKVIGGAGGDLMLDKTNNVKVLDASEGPEVILSIDSIPYARIKHVSMRVQPAELSPNLRGSSNFTLPAAGGLAYGAGGLVTGVVLAGLIRSFQSKSIDFKVSIFFDLGNGKQYEYKACDINRGVTDANVEHIEEFIRTYFSEQIDTVRKALSERFPTKLRQ